MTMSAVETIVKATFQGIHQVRNRLPQLSKDPPPPGRGVVEQVLANPESPCTCGCGDQELIISV